MKTTKELLTQLAFVIIAALCSLPTAQAQSQENLVDRVSKAVGVTLPDEYRQKVREFVTNDTIMRTRSATQFTEQFIKEQMKEDWGISKEHQYLFMWSTIYGDITKKLLYDWLDDDDEARGNDYDKSLKTIIAFSKNYRKEFKAYMDRRIEEADKRSEEALTNSLVNLVWFYNRYHNNNLPSIPTEERKQWEEKARLVFEGCKELNLDHKAILRKELGDEKKVNELLKFYGIE